MKVTFTIFIILIILIFFILLITVFFILFIYIFFIFFITIFSILVIITISPPLIFLIFLIIVNINVPSQTRALTTSNTKIASVGELLKNVAPCQGSEVGHFT